MVDMGFFHLLLNLFLIGTVIISVTETNAQHNPQRGVFKCGIIPDMNPTSFLYEAITPKGLLPWHAAIFYKLDDSFLCSGTLVSDRHVLTSAFCVLPIDAPANLQIRLGMWNLNDTILPESNQKTLFNVSNTLLFPDASPLGKKVQVPLVALLKLSRPISASTYPSVAPICLPKQIKNIRRVIETGKNLCLVSGWGFQQTITEEISDTENTARLILEEEKIESKVEAAAAQVNIFVDEFMASQIPAPETFKVPILPSQYEQDIYNKALEEELSERGGKYSKASNTAKSTQPETEGRVGDAPPQVRKAKNPEEEEDEEEEFVVDTDATDEEIRQWMRDSEEVMHEVTKNVYTLVKKGQGHKPGIVLTFPLPKRPNDTDSLDFMMASRPPHPESADHHHHHRYDAEEEMFRSKKKYTMNKKKGRSPVHDHQPNEFDDDLLLTPHVTYASEQPHGYYIMKRSAAEEEVYQAKMAAKARKVAPKVPLPKTTTPASGTQNVVPIPLDLAHRKTLLKCVAIKVEEPCEAMLPFDPEPPIGKACVIPGNSREPSSMCLVDLGSPLSCIAKGAGGDYTSPERTATANKDPKDRAYLGGLVVWKRPCFAGDKDPTVNSTIIANSYDLLDFIRRHIKD